LSQPLAGRKPFSSEMAARAGLGERARQRLRGARGGGAEQLTRNLSTRVAAGQRPWRPFVGRTALAAVGGDALDLLKVGGRARAAGEPGSRHAGALGSRFSAPKTWAVGQWGDVLDGLTSKIRFRQLGILRNRPLSQISQKGRHGKR